MEEEFTLNVDSGESLFLKKVLEKLEENYSNAEFLIPDLCKALQMSHTQFYRKLKAVTGKTPSQQLRAFRLQKAMGLIKNSELSISEIAYKVGFSDPNYFSRTFHDTFGRPPSEFR